MNCLFWVLTLLPCGLSCVQHLVADNFYTQIRERIVEGRKMLGQSTDLDKDPSLIPLAVSVPSTLITPFWGC